MSWKYGAVFALGTALWSILALSGTLAGEASRGSLDFVAAAPFGKRRIALEKLAAHLTMLGLAMAILAVMTTVSSTAYRRRRARRPDPARRRRRLRALGRLHRPLLRRARVRAGAAPRPRRGGRRRRARHGRRCGSQAGSTSGPARQSSARSTGRRITSPLVGEYDWPGAGARRRRRGRPPRRPASSCSRAATSGSRPGSRCPACPARRPRRPRADGRAFGDQLPRALAWGIGLGLIGRAARVAGRADGGPDRGTTRACDQVFATIFPDFDLGVGRRVPPALRADPVHRGGLRRRDVRLQVGVGRDGRTPGDGARDPAGPGPVGGRRRRLGAARRDRGHDVLLAAASGSARRRASVDGR